METDEPLENLNVTDADSGRQTRQDDILQQEFECLREQCCIENEHVVMDAVMYETITTDPVKEEFAQTEKMSTETWNLGRGERDGGEVVDKETTERESIADSAIENLFRQAMGHESIQFDVCIAGIIDDQVRHFCSKGSGDKKNAELFLNICREALAIYGPDLDLREIIELACQSVDSKSFSDFVCRLMGYKFTRRKSRFSINKPVEVMAPLLLESFCRYLHNICAENIDSSSSILDSPNALLPLFFVTTHRYNPAKGSRRINRDLLKSFEPCRFCQTPVLQLQERKRVAKPSGGGKTKKNKSPTNTETSAAHNTPGDTDDRTPLEDAVGATAAELMSAYEQDSGEDIDTELDQIYFKRSKQFCHDGCLFFYLLASSGTSLRNAVTVRDRSRCSGCRVDCAKVILLYRRYMRAHGQCDAETIQEGLVHAGRKAGWTKFVTSKKKAKVLAQKIRRKFEANRRREFARFGVRPGDIWQADHIVPVTRGGGCAFTLLNIRTLCTICHDEATASLTASRHAVRIVCHEGSASAENCTKAQEQAEEASD